MLLELLGVLGLQRVLGRRQEPVWKSTSQSGAPDNSPQSHFSATTRP